MQSDSSLCPGCNACPPNPGYEHCSRECATGQPNRLFLGPLPPRNAARASSSERLPHTPRRSQRDICPECDTYPITDGYEHCSRECANASMAYDSRMPGRFRLDICPECDINPITDGYEYCSRECARLSRAPPPRRIKRCEECGVPMATTDYDFCSRECAVGPPLPTRPPPPNTPRRNVGASRNVPSPAPRRRSPRKMCPECGVNPANKGFQHCSKDCARASQAAPAATPRKLIKQCEHCKTKPAASPYRYCTSACAHQHAKEKAIDNAMSGLSINSQTLRMCPINGCAKTEFKPGSVYCGNSHRRVAVDRKLEPACLLCQEFPKTEGKAFCSPKCAGSATNAAPGLLKVPKDDPTFKLVAKQFAKEWKHTSTAPEVACVYYIAMNAGLVGPFQQKRKEIEKRHNYKSDGLLKANERLRWHGTKRACFVGDPGPNALNMCGSPSCAICVIMANSFDMSKSSAGCMFGPGIYTSGTSSKSDGYVKQTTATPTKYRAMLLTRVLAGNAQKLTQADPQLKQPPPGFDSVRGVPGGGVPGLSLQYDELIVYSNDQIRPLYLVVYEK